MAFASNRYLATMPAKVWSKPLTEDHAKRITKKLVDLGLFVRSRPNRRGTYHYKMTELGLKLYRFYKPLKNENPEKTSTEKKCHLLDLINKIKKSLKICDADIHKQQATSKPKSNTQSQYKPPPYQPKNGIGVCVVNNLSAEDKMREEKRKWMQREEADKRATDELKERGELYPLFDPKDPIGTHDKLIRYREMHSNLAQTYMREANGPKPVSTPENQWQPYFDN